MFLELFPMVQRYKFESKSQHIFTFLLIPFGCFQWFKDTNLKVNHNSSTDIIICCFVVSNGSKIQI